jgi:hypothetical protein
LTLENNNVLAWIRSIANPTLVIHQNNRKNVYNYKTV